MYIKLLVFTVLLFCGLQADSQEADDSLRLTHEIDEVVVRARSNGKMLSKIANTELIGRGELVRAACCNLGESFTTNPSVDVTYSDAATGARQIKLLGLSGTYVQMLIENVPNLRGAGIPYSLGYVPGPWIQSIQVSKGAASVKNGYESITGQIDVEYLKPQGIDGFRGNAYLDSELKQELNIDGSVHLTDRLSVGALLHFENRQTDHDKDDDGFMDMPKLRQFNGMLRMAYVSPEWISQLSVKALRDERVSGTSHHANMNHDIQPYEIWINTNRYELQWKNGIPLNSDNNTSLALMLHGSIHDAENRFGSTQYDVNHKNGYAQLMFETDVSAEHNISVGAQVNYDGFDEILLLERIDGMAANLLAHPKETTTGVYAQYTYKLGEMLTVMPGIRWDYSSVYGGFMTSRLHVKYSPIKQLTLRASAGKGFRSPHVIAENISLLASGRTFIAADELRQEEAWNYGVSASLNTTIADRPLQVNIDYYYTHFINQTVLNIDGSQGGDTFSFENLSGKSYSHTCQIDATYPIFGGANATAAVRYTDARTTYDGVLRRRPLSSRYKGMLTISYATPLELWHFDVTGSINGGGELYDHSRYPSYFQLQAQVTRDFPHFSVYIGGENLTNYTIKNPIVGADNPWSSKFDATQVWGPTTGAMAYIGVRFTFEKY
ncbi:MAG: TonB-dependent receptor plug domain-containing protein [Muribaculaceae bacterium]